MSSCSPTPDLVTVVSNFPPASVGTASPSSRLSITELTGRVVPPLSPLSLSAGDNLELLPVSADTDNERSSKKRRTFPYFFFSSLFSYAGLCSSGLLVDWHEQCQQLQMALIKMNEEWARKCAALAMTMAVSDFLLLSPCYVFSPDSVPTVDS